MHPYLSMKMAEERHRDDLRLAEASRLAREGRLARRERQRAAGRGPLRSAVARVTRAHAKVSAASNVRRLPERAPTEQQPEPERQWPRKTA